MCKLRKRAWSNLERTHQKIHKACVLSRLLYGRETWTIHALHKKELDVSHMRQVWHILGTPKDLLYAELSEGTRPCRKPNICYKDVWMNRHDLGHDSALCKVILGRRQLGLMRWILLWIMTLVQTKMYADIADISASTLTWMHLIEPNSEMLFLMASQILNSSCTYGIVRG